MQTATGSTSASATSRVRASSRRRLPSATATASSPGTFATACMAMSHLDGLQRRRARPVRRQSLGGCEGHDGDLHRRARRRPPARSAADDLRRPGGRLARRSSPIHRRGARASSSCRSTSSSPTICRRGARALPGNFEARAEALGGPTTLPGQRVQTINPPGSEVGPGPTSSPRGASRMVDRVEPGLLVEPQRSIEQAHRLRLARAGLIPRTPCVTAARGHAACGVPPQFLARSICGRPAVLLALSLARLVRHRRAGGRHERDGHGTRPTIGILAQGEMGAAIFMAMWMTMMVAMMLPTVAPMVLAHLAVVRRQRRGVLATVVFVAGYLLVWLAIGVVPLARLPRVLRRWPSGAAESRWLAALAGAILVVAGAYQFTGWKRVCLDHCQSPFAFIAMHDFDGGAPRSLRAGVVHGAYCLGCCWALTAVLLVVGPHESRVDGRHLRAVPDREELDPRPRHGEDRGRAPGRARRCGDRAIRSGSRRYRCGAGLQPARESHVSIAVGPVMRRKVRSPPRPQYNGHGAPLCACVYSRVQARARRSTPARPSRRYEDIPMNAALPVAQASHLAQGWHHRRSDRRVRGRLHL